MKSGRTHLQDATPITFSQEISGWRTSLETGPADAGAGPAAGLKELALGGTAVGTGLNAPKGFDAKRGRGGVPVSPGKHFVTAPNKFHALTSQG